MSIRLDRPAPDRASPSRCDEATRAEGRARRERIALLALPLAAFALLAWRFDFLCDDAYISFRYAKHLAEGHGLRYNLGESPPVEGYSNFLWTVWLALLQRCGVDPTVGSRASSLACGALLVAWVTRFAGKRFELDRRGELACGFVLATLPPIALWATGGLATMATALAVFGCYERLFGRPGAPRALQAAGFAALAALLRADGAAWIAMLLAAGGALWLVEGRPRALLRALVTVGALLFLVVAAHVAWRLAYYGSPVPNTAKVKAGFSVARLGRGLEYLASFLLTLPGIALVLFSALRRWERATRGVWIPAGVVIAGTFAYALWVGGDFMPMGRFLLPALPFVALLFGGAWRAYPRGVAALLKLACVSLSLAAAFDRNVVPEAVRKRFQFRRDRPWETEVEMWRGMKGRAEEWSVQGRALAHCTQPGESIVLGAIGALGYYSELFVFDTYGLVSPAVTQRGKRMEGATPGHDFRVDPDFFFGEHPTYLGSVLVAAGAPADEGLLQDWERTPYASMVTIERCPLPESAGFPPGLELRLLRMIRWE